MTNKLTTTDLLLAALLVEAGAEIDTIEPKSRYSKVLLNTENLSAALLEEKLLRAARVCARTETPEEWAHYFNSTFFGSLEDRYIRLKRQVVAKRGLK